MIMIDFTTKQLQPAYYISGFRKIQTKDAYLLHGACDSFASSDHPCDVVSGVVPQAHTAVATVSVVDAVRVLQDSTVLLQGRPQT